MIVNNVTQIIWSKDRAMQLDLLLRSFLHYNRYTIGRTYVLYATSNEEFECGYDFLINDYRRCNADVVFIKQRDFRRDLIDIAYDIKSEFILGNSDDNVFINYIPDSRDLHAVSVITATSLRLHPGINYCQPASLKINIPKEMAEVSPGIFSWNWKQCDPRGCWGYPHPCDSNVYCTDRFVAMINKTGYTNPASLEIFMNNNRYHDHPYMKCFKEPCLINICNNRINQGTNNPCGGDDLKKMNYMFINGVYICDSFFKELKPSNACHIIKEYKYAGRSV